MDIRLLTSIVLLRNLRKQRDEFERVVREAEEERRKLLAQATLTSMESAPDWHIEFGETEDLDSAVAGALKRAGEVRQQWERHVAEASEAERGPIKRVARWIFESVTKLNRAVLLCSLVLGAGLGWEAGRVHSDNTEAAGGIKSMEQVDLLPGFSLGWLKHIPEAGKTAHFKDSAGEWSFRRVGAHSEALDGLARIRRETLQVMQELASELPPGIIASAEGMNLTDAKQALEKLETSGDVRAEQLRVSFERAIQRLQEIQDSSEESDAVLDVIPAATLVEGLVQHNGVGSPQWDKALADFQGAMADIGVEVTFQPYKVL